MCSSDLFFILGATHVLNPDEFIVKTNLVLMRQGRSFDAGYNASLSQDAVPALIAAFPDLGLRDQCVAKNVLWGRLSSRNEQDNNDFRSWNWSRSKATPLLIENTKFIQEDMGVFVPGKQRCTDLFSEEDRLRVRATQQSED